MAAVLGVVDSRPLGLRGRASASARAAQEGQPKPGIWGEVPTRTGVALDAVTVQAFDTYGFERMRIGGDRGQRSRVRQPVPRPGRRAHAPGGWGAAGRGLAAGRAGSVGSPAPAAVRLWQRPRRCRQRHRCGRRPARARLDQLVAGARASARPGWAPQWTRCPAPASRRLERPGERPGDRRTPPTDRRSCPRTSAPRMCSATSGGPRRAGRSAGHAGRPRGECGWDPVGQLLAPPAARVDAAGRLSPGSGERGAVRGGRLFVLPAPRSTDVVGIFRLTTRSSASSARCSLNNTTSGGSGHRSHWRRNLHL